MSEYPANWKVISKRIREDRAQGQCECSGECGLHCTTPGPRRCEEMNGQPAKWAKGTIVLTTAHLCHDKACEDESHMKAMCQRCHLRYDRKDNAAKAKETRRLRFEVAQTTVMSGRGPVGGYDFGNKRQYRREFWAHVDRYLSHVPKPQRTAFYLETGEGLETLFLIEQKGYRPENLFPVNSDKREIAKLSDLLKSRGYDRVRAFAMDALEAAHVLKGEGISPNIINLDFTSCFSLNLRHYVEKFRNEIIRDGMIVGINMLRGRERELMRTYVNRFHERMPTTTNVEDYFRATEMPTALRGYPTPEGAFCFFHFKNFHWNKYKSANGQTMLWTISHLERHSVKNGPNSFAFQDAARFMSVAEVSLLPHCHLVKKVWAESGINLVETASNGEIEGTAFAKWPRPIPMIQDA